MSVARRRIDAAFERLAGVDSRFWSGLFFGLIGLYTLAVVLEATTYGSAARLFPIVVGVPFLGLVALKLLLLAAGDRLDLESTELFEVRERFEHSDEVDVPAAVRYRRELEMALWLAGLTLVLWAVGFLLALVVFLFTFIAVYERDLLRAGLAAGATYAFVYGFFVELLGASVYGGVVALGIPGFTT